MARYDYLIVGAGLFGAVFAQEALRAGKKCLVIDRRAHVGGNVYTQEREGIQVHVYGAHIFHTSDREIWEYVNRFASFRPFVNAPLAVYGDRVYHLPFNMNTFYAMWGVRTPAEARAMIARQTEDEGSGEPRNLEEKALRSVGRDLYETLVRGYTEKQWGRPCRELPPSILGRLPLRFTWDNNYFSDRWQGIPEEGYTRLVERLLEGSEVRLGVDYFSLSAAEKACAGKTLFTGPIDAFFGRRFGPLEYRSLRFETETLDIEDFQGNAVVNYTAADVPYTRVIEHKHFGPGGQKRTIVSREYPAAWTEGAEPYYPVNDEKNTALYARYRALADETPGVLFGGRLGSYRYWDMDKTVAAAIAAARGEFPG